MKVNAVKNIVRKNFPKFGVNKRQEISRLLYEISRIEGNPPENIIEEILRETSDFTGIKQCLIRRRFPVRSASGEPFKPYLPKLELDPSDKVRIRSFKIGPKNIYVEAKAGKGPLIGRLKKAFPLNAALRCIEAGFTVGFHFDPIIHHAGWERQYKSVVDQLFNTIDAKVIRWISLGTLRFAPALKKVIEVRFPQTRILDAELAPDFDGKMRYSKTLRIEIYKKMLKWIRKRSKRVPVYLCMENKEVLFSI